MTDNEQSHAHRCVIVSMDNLLLIGDIDSSTHLMLNQK